MSKWTESRVEKYVLGVFLDISGAFDNAWWPAVLHQMKELGAEERVIRITRDYLVGRSAILAVPIVEVSRPLSKGCPQGSQYGPELWNILIDSLLGLDGEEGELSVGYAHDALLHVAGNTRAQVVQKAEAKLEKAQRWARGMKLTFSDTKTKFICLKVRLVPPYTVRLGKSRIKEVRELEYLGVTLDDRWGFEIHVKRVAEKAVPMFQRLRRVIAPQWGLSGCTLKAIFSGVFVS